MPSQNAVAELIEEKSLMRLDKALLPNLKNLDPSFLKPSYDPTGDYHVIKDFGITMFFFNNKIVTDELKTMHDFYMALPKHVSKGRTNLLDGAEEVVPLALMALGLDPNTTSQNDFNQVKSFLLSIRKGVTTIDSSAYIDDAIAGKIILSQGWNGDVRRIVQGRAKQKDITADHPDRGVGDLGGQLVHPGVRAASGGRARLDQLAADPEHRRDRDELPQLQDPDAERAGPVARGAARRPHVQRAQDLHGQLPLHPQRQPAGGAGPDPDLHGVQGRLMAVAEKTPDVAAAPAATRRRRSFRPHYPAWLVAPSLLYYTVFFLGPMAILVAFSLATQQGFGSLRYGFDTSQYRQIGSSLYLTIFERTLVMAGLGTVATIAVGYPVAYWMARYLSTYKMLALLLIVVPFWTSFLIRTYALKIILDPHGYLARDLGINILYTKYAVAVGLVYNYLPLFILPVFASLERMDWTLIEAATDLGARPFTAFREITLRLTLPGVVTGALLVFIPMTGEYIIPNILGGGNYEFVGNLIGDQFNQAQNQPFGSALSIGLMAALSVFVIAYILVATKEEQFGA